MINNLQNSLQTCETLMLDMDGTLLDLAYDSFIWLEVVPKEFAIKHRVSNDVAQKKIYQYFVDMQGSLDWYCLDKWSQLLDLDVLQIHRQHKSRINFLPGAKDFLEKVSRLEKKLLLVTNSNRDVFLLKSQITGVDQYFEKIYISHELGSPKEDQKFWFSLQQIEPFNPVTTCFVDDNPEVLKSAQQFGIKSLFHVTQPDASTTKLQNSEFDAISANGFIEYLSIVQIKNFIKFCKKNLKKNGFLILGSRNRLYNLFSLNEYSNKEIHKKTFKKFYLESINLAKSHLNNFLKSKKINFEDAQLKQPKTSINVDKRHQFSPSQLINLLERYNFKIIEISPINCHPVIPKIYNSNINYKKISNFISLDKNKLGLIPFASSFMIAAKKLNF